MLDKEERKLSFFNDTEVTDITEVAFYLGRFSVESVFMNWVVKCWLFLCPGC